MEYRVINADIDLNDPEEGLAFAGADQRGTLSLTDWRGRRVTFRFEGVYRFWVHYSNGYLGLPEAEFLELPDSVAVQSLKAEGTAGAGEDLHHYVLSTNEDQWCEIISAGYAIEVG